MKLGELSTEQLRTALAGPGLWFHAGPFSVQLRSSLRRIAEGVRLLYQDYPVCETQAFADFHVRVGGPRNVRRWLRPQVCFEIDGRTPFKPLPAPHALPVLEWGLNWCVANYAHQYLMMHSAVIARDGRAVIMPAPPGSGKSTLCAGLVCRGWRLLSDEMALIEPDTGDLVALARPVSLKDASIDIIRAFAPEAVIGPASPDTTKGTVAHMRAPRESVLRAAEPATPAWVVFPRYESDAEARLEPVEKGNSFMQLAENSFNYHVLGTRGFDTLAAIADQCDCYQFTYSRLEDAVEVFDELAAAV